MQRARIMRPCMRMGLCVFAHAWLDTRRVGAVGGREEGRDWRVGTGVMMERETER
jgi:hypothetical protein